MVALVSVHAGGVAQVEAYLVGLDTLLTQALNAVLERRPANPAAALAAELIRIAPPDGPDAQLPLSLQSTPEEASRTGPKVPAGLEDAKEDTTIVGTGKPGKGMVGKEVAGKARREARPFDLSTCAQRHVALQIAYIGARYHGCAWQPDTPHTVEAHLFAAAEKARLIADRSSCDFSRGGRTDKGVSALGQVVAMRLRSNAPRPVRDPESGGGDRGPEVAELPVDRELDYAHTLNRLLPPDIRITAWAPVPDSFSARHPTTPPCHRPFAHLPSAVAHRPQVLGDASYIQVLLRAPRHGHHGDA